jgi:hypothetical protein
MSRNAVESQSGKKAKYMTERCSARNKTKSIKSIVQIESSSAPTKHFTNMFDFERFDCLQAKVKRTSTGKGL